MRLNGEDRDGSEAGREFMWLPGIFRFIFCGAMEERRSKSSENEKAALAGAKMAKTEVQGRHFAAKEEWKKIPGNRFLSEGIEELEKHGTVDLKRRASRPVIRL
jgi:hypothetical protein